MRYALLLLLTIALACSKAEKAEPSTTETKPDVAPVAADAKPAVPSAEAKAKASQDAQPAEDTLLGAKEKPSVETFADALPQFGPPEIKLIAPGEPPLQKLSWKFKQGSKVTAAVHNSMSVEMSAGVRSAPETSAPTLEFEVSLDAVEVSPDGPAKVAFRLVDGKVDPKSSHEVLVSQQIKALEALEGLAGTYSVHANGAIDEFAFDAAVNPRGAELADDLKRILRMTTIPVPDEKVGVGAKWTVEQVVEQGGVRLRERRLYEISELDGSRLGLTVSVQTQAPPQEVRIPGAGSRRNYQLLGYNAEGSERLQIDLAQLAPKSRDSKVTTTQRMTTAEQIKQGSLSAMQLKMHVNTTVTRR